MQARHLAQMVLLSALWGGSFPLIRIAAPAFGPWGLSGLRCLLATLVLAVIMRVLRQAWPAREAWPRLAIVSVLTIVIPFQLFNWAGLILPSGYSAILNATVPVFSLLGAAALGDERLTTRRVVGCGLGFTGVALLVRLGPVEVTPIVLVAAAACVVASAGYGIGAIFMKRSTQTTAPLAGAAAVHVVAMAAFALPTAATASQMQPTPGAWAAVAVLGMFTSGVMYWLSLRLMREIPATAATSSALMIPLFGVTWGRLFLGEPLTPGMLPGALLVLAATALITGFTPWARRPGR